MTKFRLRNLERYKVSGHGSNMTLSFQRPQSDTGKIMERCPTEGCQPAIFQLGTMPEDRSIVESHKDTIRRQPGTNGVTCPYCGHDGDDDDFIPEEDIEHAKILVMHEFKKDISDMLGSWTKDFNRQQPKGSFLSIKMEHKSKHSPRPFAYRKDLLRSISCHVCLREYGVFALSIFCPDCGAPNVSNHFNREIEIIDRQIDISRQASEAGDEELAYRLIANAHEDVVTALETTLKSVFRYLVNKHRPEQAEHFLDSRKIGSAFQNLEKAKKQYKKLDIDLLAGIEEGVIEQLQRQIQKRHVIGHNLGLADEKYISVDDNADVGRNVPILATEIESFAHGCAQLIQLLEKELGYGP